MSLGNVAHGLAFAARPCVRLLREALLCGVCRPPSCKTRCTTSCARYVCVWQLCFLARCDRLVAFVDSLACRRLCGVRSFCLAAQSVDLVIQIQTPYHHAKVGQWNNDVIEHAMKKLTQLNKPFKYIGTDGCLSLLCYCLYWCGWGGWHGCGLSFLLFVRASGPVGCVCVCVCFVCVLAGRRCVCPHACSSGV